MSYNQSYICAKEKVATLFRNKKEKDKGSSRRPPGQVITKAFPILDLGVKPDFDPKTWRLNVYGLVKEKKFSYADILKMPSTSLTADFHCVTHWSKLDVRWKGILFRDFLNVVKPKTNWKFLIQESTDGYATNVPREDLEKKNVLLAYELEGKPLPREHGWPIRLIIPHLYAWKGAKFLKALKFADKDEPGFWEVRGYHNHGDALKQERYS